MRGNAGAAMVHVRYWGVRVCSCGCGCNVNRLLPNQQRCSSQLLVIAALLLPLAVCLALSFDVVVVSLVCEFESDLL